VTKKITIEGFGFKPLQPDYHPTWRIYGTRAKDSWELVTEFQLIEGDGCVAFPAFELEPTGARGLRAYQLIAVDKAGREKWHDETENELQLTRAMVREFGGSLDVGSWLLYNLELNGVIAPGQLHD
jgi:hypothetical protein